MKRIVFGTAALAAVLTTVAMAQARSTRGRTASSPTVQLRETSLGKILVNSAGMTVFDFTKDSRNKNTCQSISGCASAWPALVTSGTPKAGSGLSASKLGTIKLSDGKKQVTYDGRPLYLFAGDKRAGETSYVGVKEFGGTWYAVNAGGASVNVRDSSQQQESSGGGW